MTYHSEKDNTVYEDRQLQFTSTLIVKQTDIPGVKEAYQKICSGLKKYFQPFSIRYMDGVVVESSSSCDYVMQIVSDEDEILIHTTGGTYKVVEKQALNAEPEESLLQYVEEDPKHTAVFSKINNVLRTPMGELRGLLKKGKPFTKFGDIIVPGEVVAYTEESFTVRSTNGCKTYFANQPEWNKYVLCNNTPDIFSRGSQLYIRSSAGAVCSQDFMILKKTYSDERIRLLCATQANPEVHFVMEV